jgi:hypothetical protein
MRCRPAAARLLAVLVLLPLLAACEDLGDSPPVTIGGERLSIGDLRAIYADLPPADRPRLGTRAQRTAFVEGVVDRTLLRERGREIAEENPELLGRLEYAREETLIRRLRTLESGDDSPTAEDIERAHGILANEYLVERFFFADSAAAAAAHARVTAGEALRDAALAENGVYAGVPIWLKWSPFPDSLLDALPGLEPGDMPAPIVDGPRRALIEVLERREVPETSLEDVRDQIVRGLRNRQRAERLQEFLDGLRDAADIVIREEAVEDLVERTRRSILEGGRTLQHPGWALPDIDDAGRTVAEWSGGRLTAGEYRSALESMVSLQRPHLNLHDEVRDVCRRAVDRGLLLAEASRRDLAAEWWTARALERLERGRFLQIAVERIESEAEMNPTAADSAASLLHSTQPELFRSQAKARIVRFEFTNREAADDEARRIRAAGGAMERIAEILASKSVLAGSYRIVDVVADELGSPAAHEFVFLSEPGRLSAPLEFFGQWVLIEVQKVDPAYVLSAEEVLADVRARLSGGGEREALERWLAERKQAVGVAIDEQALNALAPGA